MTGFESKPIYVWPSPESFTKTKGTSSYGRRNHHHHHHKLFFLHCVTWRAPISGWCHFQTIKLPLPIKSAKLPTQQRDYLARFTSHSTVCLLKEEAFAGPALVRFKKNAIFVLAPWTRSSSKATRPSSWSTSSRRVRTKSRPGRFRLVSFVFRGADQNFAPVRRLSLSPHWKVNSSASECDGNYDKWK